METSKSLLTTLTLLAVCAVAAVVARNHGVFKSPGTPRPSTTTLAEAPLDEVAPTPTPLPFHFPETENDLAPQGPEELSLGEAFHACWPSRKVPDDLRLDGEALKLENLEKLFGSLDRREPLDDGRIGLVFSEGRSSAPSADVAPRAVGSATESSGRFLRLQVRAAGRMLQCKTQDDNVLCHCI